MYTLFSYDSTATAHIKTTFRKTLDLILACRSIDSEKLLGLEPVPATLVIRPPRFHFGDFITAEVCQC